MATEELKIILQGESTTLDRASAKAAKAIERVSQKATEYDKVAKELNRTSTTGAGVLYSYSSAATKVEKTTKAAETSIASLNRTASRVKATAEGAAVGLKKVSASSNSAQTSLFALTGVVQDAPYGFRGIANNITFFTQSMAYSAREAGGFKAALKAMGGALLGPAGIIFAVSSVVAILDSMSGSFGRSSGAVDHFKDEIDSLNSSLQTSGDAFASGLGGASKRLTTLNLLYKATQNNNLAMKDRLAAAGGEFWDAQKTFKGT